VEQVPPQEAIPIKASFDPVRVRAVPVQLVHPAPATRFLLLTSKANVVVLENSTIPQETNVDEADKFNVIVVVPLVELSV
jgi:hypothetical protein